MRSIRSIALLEAALVFCAGACASSGTSHRSDDRTRVADVNQPAIFDVSLHRVERTGDRDVSVTMVQAFDALPAAYVKLGIKNAAVVDNNGGVYTVGARNLRLHGTLGGTRLSSYIDCGSGTMSTPADTYDVNFSATTYITARTGGATLHTLVEASAQNPAANSPRVRCVSTGAFERQLATLVDATH